MNQSFIERRKYPRKEIFLVMEIEKNHHAGDKLSVLTSNISAGGVYFKTIRGEEFQAGEETDLTIFISTAVPDGKTHLNKLIGRGKVIRREEPFRNADTDKDEKWAGIALQFNEPLKIRQLSL